MTWLLDTLLATGALIALVLVLRRPVARLFGPGLAYALWALPLLRLMLPPLLLPARHEAWRLVQVAPDLVLPVGLPAVQSGSITDAVAPDWIALALAVWLAGALAFAVWRLRGYRAMRRLLLQGAVPVGQAGTVRLVESPATQAPVAFGVRDKVVALPQGFMARSDRLGRDLAIAHELEHHAARDLAVNLAMQPLLALHWFNPLAWLGWRALRRDQEAACDARVVAGAGPELRAAYGRLIAQFAQSPRLALAAPMACPVLGEASVIHRLRSLTMADPTPRRRLTGRAMMAAALLALPLTASISYAAAEHVPAPPAPPAVAVAGSGQRIEIVEKHSDAAPGDAGLKTRVIQRDGQTVVFKTDQVLSDAEVEQRIASALRAAPEPPQAPQPPEPPAVPEAPARFVFHNGHGTQTIVVPNAAQLTAQINAEVARGLAEARRGTAEAAAGRAEAISAILDARSDVAADENVPEEIRKRVLQQLDREIERLSRQGKS